MQKLASLEGGEASTSTRQRVESARAIQEARFAQANKPNMTVNGDMGQPKCNASVNSTSQDSP